MSSENEKLELVLRFVRRIRNYGNNRWSRRDLDKNIRRLELQLGFWVNDLGREFEHGRELNAEEWWNVIAHEHHGEIFMGVDELFTYAKIAAAQRPVWVPYPTNFNSETWREEHKRYEEIVAAWKLLGRNLFETILCER